MEPALIRELLSVEDYLAGEQRSEVRHEYVAGELYAMAGASREHNLIAGNIYATLRTRLRGGPCQSFMVDLKVHVPVLGENVFYYPDVVVSCDPRDTERFFLSYPKLIIEVSSEATERLDRREKLLSYLRLESLDDYLLVAQDKIEVTLYHRGNQWLPKTFTRIEDNVLLRSVRIELPVRTIYEEVLV